jgi:hypothetical protein
VFVDRRSAGVFVAELAVAVVSFLHAKNEEAAINTNKTRVNFFIIKIFRLIDVLLPIFNESSG